MNVDRSGNVADAANQILRRGVSHDPRQCGVGIEQRTAWGCHINAVDRALEQLAIAFLGKALLCQGAHRRLPRRVGIDQGAAEYFGSTRNVADLVVDVGRRDRGVFLASRQRANRSRDRREWADGPPHHQEGREKSDQDAGGAERDALPFRLCERPCKFARQHMTAARADFAQEFGDTLDQASLGTEYLLVDIRNLTFADRDGDDRLGIIVDRGAEFCIRYRQHPHALGGPFGGRRIARQQPGGDAALGLKQGRGDNRVRRLGNCCVEFFAQWRQADDQLGAAVDQRRNALDSAVVGRQSRRDAVDHVLLLGSEFEPGLLQKVV